VAILVAGGNVLWFAGILRLVGEVLGAARPNVIPSELLWPFVVGAGLMLLALGLLWSWEPVRRWSATLKADLRESNGLPRTPSAAATERRRPLGAIAIVLVLSVVTAAVLPGPLAAALAIVAGLVLRVAASAIAARADPRTGSG
jgi:hypothetical protein